MDADALPIELRVSGDPIIQVYSDNVNITKKLFLDGGDLNIKDANSTTWIKFYNYSDATTIKEAAYIYLSEFSVVFAIDRPVLETRTTPAIEIRVTAQPIIQVYRDKVDITKNLNVAGDITFTGNLYDANGIFTSGTGGTGGTSYDDVNRLNYEFLKVPTGESESIVNIQELIIIQDANIQEPTIDLFIQEPTSSPSVPITTTNSDYKYMAFTYTSGATFTPYTITFNDNTECDILVVGGGGGGGTSYNTGSSAPGAGGGAGGLIFLSNQPVPSGTYNIVVGKGGDGDNFNSTNAPARGKQGNNSSFSYHSTSAVGGGGGGSRSGFSIGGNGGSGGGTSFNIFNSIEDGGIGTVGQGNNGGRHFSNASLNASTHVPYAGGGGGAGGAGKGNDAEDSIDGDGGIGKYIVRTFNFKEDFGLPTDDTLGEFFNGNMYFAGGGSCGHRK